MMTSFKAKLGKRVEVHSNGSNHRGILKMITESEVILKGDTKTWAIPLSNVKKIISLEDRKLSASPLPGNPAVFDQKTDPYGTEDL